MDRNRGEFARNQWGNGVSDEDRRGRKVCRDASTQRREGYEDGRAPPHWLDDAPSPPSLTTRGQSPPGEEDG